MAFTEEGGGLTCPTPRAARTRIHFMMAVSLRGYAATTAAALPWASSGVAGKALFAAGITPVQLVQTRLVVAAAALALFLALRAPGLLRLQRWQDACLLVLLGVLLAATQFSYFFAVSKIEVAAAILLQYMAPVFGPGSGNETDILHLGDGEWIAVARDELRERIGIR